MLINTTCKINHEELAKAIPDPNYQKGFFKAVQFFCEVLEIDGVAKSISFFPNNEPDDDGGPNGTCNSAGIWGPNGPIEFEIMFRGMNAERNITQVLEPLRMNWFMLSSIFTTIFTLQRRSIRMQKPTKRSPTPNVGGKSRLGIVKSNWFRCSSPR